MLYSLQIKELFMKIVMIPLILSLFSYLAADGFRDYQRSCQICHKEPAIGSKMKEEAQWEKLFDNKAEGLRRVHAANPDAMEKLDANYFKKHMRTLRNFLMQNASDNGGIIRSCDGSGTRC